MPRAINIEAVRREYELDPDKCLTHLSEAIESGQIDPDDVSIRDVAETFLGENVVRAMEPWRKSGRRTMREAVSAVDTSAFSNITGQIFFAMVKKAWEPAEVIFETLVTTRQSPFQFGEKVPGIGGIGDEAEIVDEAHPYPTVGVSEEFIEFPAPRKRGFIVPVTREAIVFDRTGVLKERCAGGAKFLALNKLKRVLDTVFGITNTYKRNGTATNTYLTAGAYINQQVNALVDWTDIENAELLFDAMTDPQTGEPIGAGLMAGPMVAIVPTALHRTLRRVVGATEIRFGDGASGTTATYGQNPLNGTQIAIFTTPYVKSRTGSASTWFHGSPKDAFVYNEVWGIESSEAPQGNQAQFERDIEIQHKVSEYGTAGVMEPRYMTKNTAA